MKILISLLLCFATINKVFSLDCYVTDLKALKSGDLQPKVQNCRDNIRQALELEGKSITNVPEDTVFNCYQVDVISDAVSIAIKGCIPEGGCDLLKPVFRKTFTLEHATSVKEVNCNECGTTRCNAGTPHSNSSNIKFSLNIVIAILVAFAIIM